MPVTLTFKLGPQKYTDFQEVHLGRGSQRQQKQQ